MVQIIPSIDLINQKVVRLKKGDFYQITEYNESFEDLVSKYIDLGYPTIHVVDLDGAKRGRSSQAEILKRLPQKFLSKIQWSGGLRSAEDFKSIFQFDLNGIVVSSVILENFSLLEKVTATSPYPVRWALDMNNAKIATQGWQKLSNLSYKNLFELAKMNGVPQVLVTSVQKDGLDQGPDFELYSKLKKEFPELNLVASGGVRNRSDLHQLGLLGIGSAIVGRALLESDRSLS